MDQEARREDVRRAGSPRLASLDDLLAQIASLPASWHGAGSVSPQVLEAFRRHVGSRTRLRHSVETGTGRTTLLLSHLSEHHIVFTKDDTGDGNSLDRVRESPLLNIGAVTFVVGPTQRTLVGHEFAAPIDLAFIDGPHAYPFPELEYWAIYPHLAEGAWLVIDDIQIPTLGNMFEVLRDDAMYDLVEVVEATAFFRRTDAPALDPYGEGWWEQGFNGRSSLRHLAPSARVAALVKNRVPARLKRSLRALGGTGT